MLKRLRSLSKRLFIVLNGVAVAAIFLSYLATLISPERFPLLAFFGVAYGPILLVNILFILFWLLVKKRLALISSIAILIGFVPLSNYFQINPTFSKINPPEPHIRVVSQNVKLFGWYNWSENIANRDDMMSSLEKINGDIYCFQEFFHNSGPGIFETKELLKLVLDAPHVYDEYTATVGKTQHYGIAIYSKYPMVNTGQIRFEGEKNNNMCIYTDVVVYEDTIRIYNVHAASIRFTDTHYAVVKELSSQKEKAKIEISDFVGIAKRMANAYRRRAQQVEKIKAHALESPYPVIICGDFNDTPVSYSYATISDGLEDAFKVSGSGIGSTYIGAFPSFRIDYIFHSTEYKSGNYTTHPEEVSDHRAISCDLYLEESI